MKKLKISNTIPIVCTVYEDSTAHNTNGWRVYDDTPAGATINNIYDEDIGSNTIQFTGSGVNNGYILGNLENQVNAWNTSAKTIQWTMKYNENFIIYIRIETIEGMRYIKYTNKNVNEGVNGDYISFGLGEKSRNDTWQTFTRNLELDLKMYQPNNIIIAVNAFLIRGSGLVSDVVMIDSSFDNFTNLNCSFYFSTYEFDADNGSKTCIWKSSCTQSGNTIIKDFSGSESMNPRNFIKANCAIYFIMDDGDGGYEIWMIDSITNECSMIANILSMGSFFRNINCMLYVRMDYDQSGIKLWKHDRLLGFVLVE